MGIHAKRRWMATGQVAITAKQLRQLLEDQQYKCALTGVELKPETASLDHKVPLARDGQHAIENLWILDHQVNIAKGTMTTDEFIDLCRRVVAYADATEKCGV